MELKDKQPLTIDTWRDRAADTLRRLRSLKEEGEVTLGTASAKPKILGEQIAGLSYIMAKLSEDKAGAAAAVNCEKKRQEAEIKGRAGQFVVGKRFVNGEPEYYPAYNQYGLRTAEEVKAVLESQPLTSPKHQELLDFSKKLIKEGVGDKTFNVAHIDKGAFGFFEV